MPRDPARARIAILRALNEAQTPLGAARLAGALASAGLHLQPRTIRLHLLHLDQEGLTRLVARRLGRAITDAGRQALAQTDVAARAEFVTTRMDHLAYQVTFRSDGTAGSVAMDLSLTRGADLSRVLAEMRPFFSRSLAMGTKLVLARGPSVLGETEVPSGAVGLGSVSSVTLNTILMAHGIPVRMRFGGLLQMEEGIPRRFVEAIAYDGCTSDPIGMFIRSGMTRVRSVARTGSGIISASLREIPGAAAADMRRLRTRLNRLGFGRILMVGQPDQPLFDLPVAQGNAGLVVLDGLNPIAAAHEAGVPVTIRAQAGLQAYDTLRSIDEIRRDIRKAAF